MMHQKDIAESIAKISGISVESAEEFASAVIKVLTDTLVNGENVDVNFIGSFNLTENGTAVKYISSKNINEIVNSSFSVFEPVELADNYPAIPVPVIEPEPSVDDTESEMNLVGNAPVFQAEESRNVEDEKESIEPMNAEYDNERPQERSASGWIFLIGLVLGLAIGFLCGFFLRPVIMGEKANNVEEVFVSDPDNVSEAEPVASIEEEGIPKVADDTSSNEETKEIVPVAKAQNGIVTDTIKEGVFLTTLARKHYDGRYEFWIYIYKENTDRIANPQNVPVGTVLVIPPREKYGINPSSLESIDRALRETEKYNEKMHSLRMYE